MQPVTRSTRDCESRQTQTEKPAYVKPLIFRYGTWTPLKSRVLNLHPIFQRACLRFGRHVVHLDSQLVTPSIDLTQPRPHDYCDSILIQCRRSTDLEGLSGMQVLGRGCRAALRGYRALDCVAESTDINSSSAVTPLSSQ